MSESSSQASDDDHEVRDSFSSDHENLIAVKVNRIEDVNDHPVYEVS